MTTIKAASILSKEKYYGTIIELSNGEQFRVWIRGEKTLPSHRQAKKDHFNSPAEGIYDGYYTDSHYETQSCFELCEKIVKGINNG